MIVWWLELKHAPISGDFLHFFHGDLLYAPFVKHHLETPRKNQPEKKKNGMPLKKGTNSCVPKGSSLDELVEQRTKPLGHSK